MKRNDLVIIGGGVVGLATGYQYLRSKPGASLVLLEKDEAVAKHQSSHNSGVLHTGIYYKPGSLKANNCTRGKKLLEEFCRAENVPYKITGKVIVATSSAELPTLQTIYERGQANGVRCKIIDQSELKEIEPHVNGVKGIQVEDAGIVDFPAVAIALKQKIEQLGGKVVTNAKVIDIKEQNDEAIVSSSAGDFSCARLVNTAGLYSDRILKLSGETRPCRIVPFRGEYYLLKKEYDHLCKALIYPVPNPDFPFLGVHFTRGIHGEVECGPNAVLALAREGYRWNNINLADLFDSLSYAGLQKFLMRYWREGMHEIKRSISKRLFVAALQRLVPEIKSEYLENGPSGVRAQAIGADGKLIDDFLITRTKRAMHVLNAPSPAATSCLSIGLDLAKELAA